MPHPSHLYVQISMETPQELANAEVVGPTKRAKLSQSIVPEVRSTIETLHIPLNVRFVVLIAFSTLNCGAYAGDES